MNITWGKKKNLAGANSEPVIHLFYSIFSGNTGSAVGKTVRERPGFTFYCKAGSRWLILLTKNVAFVNVIDHVGNHDKEY